MGKVVVNDEALDPVFLVKFGLSSTGESLDYLGNEFENLDEIAEICKAYQKTVKVRNGLGFVVGLMNQDGNWKNNTLI